MKNLDKKFLEYLLENKLVLDVDDSVENVMNMFINFLKTEDIHFSNYIENYQGNEDILFQVIEFKRNGKLIFGYECDSKNHTELYTIENFEIISEFFTEFFNLTSETILEKDEIHNEYVLWYGYYLNSEINRLKEVKKDLFFKFYDSTCGAIIRLTKNYNTFLNHRLSDIDYKYLYDKITYTKLEDDILSLYIIKDELKLKIGLVNVDDEWIDKFEYYKNDILVMKGKYDNINFLLNEVF